MIKLYAKYISAQNIRFMFQLIWIYNEICYIIVVLSEQYSPRNPFKQAHVKVATPSIQTPLFRQGLETQSLISVKYISCLVITKVLVNN